MTVPQSAQDGQLVLLGEASWHVRQRVLAQSRVEVSSLLVLLLYAIINMNVFFNGTL